MTDDDHLELPLTGNGYRPFSRKPARMEINFQTGAGTWLTRHLTAMFRRRPRPTTAKHRKAD
jgi:hypothetical protein